MPEWWTLPATTPAERWARVQAYVAQVGTPPLRPSDAADVYWHVYGEDPPETAGAGPADAGTLPLHPDTRLDP